MSGHPTENRNERVFFTVVDAAVPYDCHRKFIVPKGSDIRFEYQTYLCGDAKELRLEAFRILDPMGETIVHVSLGHAFILLHAAFS